MINFTLLQHSTTPLKNSKIDNDLLKKTDINQTAWKALEY